MPVSLLVGIRRSMTGASASLLLIAIVSLNIVWGYPWMGMFAATSTMLVIGIIVNRLLGPRLAVQLSLPNYAVSGDSFSVTMHLHHRGRLPTFDNRIGFENQPSRLLSNRERSIVPCDQQSFQMVPFIEANGRLQTHVSLKGFRRGIHILPPVEATTLFPFHLFECKRAWDGNASIAIAPAPLDRDKDVMCGALIDQISRWTRRWQSGDSFDFAGNREYEVGMPVRRWDFRSWARLGRPIVQEFQSPSTRMATIIVDSSVDTSIHSDKSVKEQEADFEQLLRWVATAIEHWSRLSVATRMYVSSEPASAFLGSDYLGVSDLPKLMVQLAAATMIEANESERRIETVLGNVDPKSVILFTVRKRFGPNQGDQDVGMTHQTEYRDSSIGQVNIVRYESEPKLRGNAVPDLAEVRDAS
ncbi:hypothetical protein LF1_37480 [Rubripirellula obstinata]|uniref:Uncharacterized protein n=1 Tax=Rubripirellula obstinata TaxID=406547 RepID=A0A5B1CLH9_9BACT|nr:DUF58 domain-containing protein [Rubripirellula obstinata]KAA1261202.1 hypothetical protein LF1_37480 [Rubripirellula obstinata]